MNALFVSLRYLCVQDEKLETENHNYEMSQTPIEDKSLLGVHGQKLCENIDVHWLTPVTSGQSVSECFSVCLQR